MTSLRETGIGICWCASGTQRWDLLFCPFCWRMWWKYIPDHSLSVALGPFRFAGPWISSLGHFDPEQDTLVVMKKEWGYDPAKHDIILQEREDA